MVTPKLGTQFNALLNFAQTTVAAATFHGGNVESVHRAFQTVERDVFVPAGINHGLELPESMRALPAFCREVVKNVGIAMDDVVSGELSVTGGFLSEQNVEWSILRAVKNLYPSIFRQERVPVRFLNGAFDIFRKEGASPEDSLSHILPAEEDIFGRLSLGCEIDRERDGRVIHRDIRHWVGVYGEAAKKLSTSKALEDIELAIFRNPIVGKLYLNGLYAQKRHRTSRLSIEGTDVSHVFNDVPPGKKVLFIDFPPKNIPEDRLDDAIIADHHGEGMECKTATSEVWRLLQEGALDNVVKVVGNHMDTDRVMAEALAHGLIRDMASVGKAIAAARAGDHLIGDMSVMKFNWIVMSMIHGDPGGAFDEKPEHEIVMAAPLILSNPQAYEKYYQSMVGFMEASTARIKKSGLQVEASLVIKKDGTLVRGKDYVGYVDTGDQYAHPLSAYLYYLGYQNSPFDLIVKRSDNPEGGSDYEIGMVPAKNVPPQYNLSAAFEELKRLEAESGNPNFDPKNNWGCAPDRAGGSPRGYGSVLTAEQVMDVVERLIIGERTA